MRCLAIALLLSTAACETGGGSTLPDANLSLPMCTGVVYDSCLSNAGCMSMNCKLYDQDAIQVCTQACDANNPCPMQNGQAATCNNRGLCKPPAANACHP
ncbi:MAG: hypothetical protein IPQ07_42585 [Myxococcales bacterium]|nr:hypothetical protein [Myxococcales bacterium]